MSKSLEQQVAEGVDVWLEWLPTWTPATFRGRARPCRRCTGSPFLLAVGIGRDVPHQVAHALVARMQKIVDREVEHFTQVELPMLHGELSEAEMWKNQGYDPTAGLAPEYEGIDPDPEPENHEQPYLFTLAEVAEADRPAPPLPRPPLTAEEKAQLRQDIQMADQRADEAGRLVCFSLATHRRRIQAAIERFVEPHIQELLADLDRFLTSPDSR